MTDDTEDHNEFLKEAGSSKRPGLIADFLQFMREETKWWLTPILVVFALVAVLLLLASTGVAPWLYALW